MPAATHQTATLSTRSQSPPRRTQRTPVSQMQAAIASSSIRPYMWIVSGPSSSVPVCGEGMKAWLTWATFCPPVPRPAAPSRSDQDLDRRLVRTALLDQLDREVQVDVVTAGEGDGVTGVVAGADELLRAPVLDAIQLGVDLDVKVRRRHPFGIRCGRAGGSPPAGGSQRMRRASSSACDLVRSPSRRSVRPPRTQSRTAAWIRTGRSA